MKSSPISPASHARFAVDEVQPTAHRLRYEQHHAGAVYGLHHAGRLGHRVDHGLGDHDVFAVF